MRALVTGGSQGIGGAVCRRLAADAVMRGETPSIVLTVRRFRADVDDLVSTLQEMGARVLPLEAELSDPAASPRVVEAAVGFCGGLDALVSNAGLMGAGGPLAAAEPADWDRVFAVNVRAPWLLAKAAFPSLTESGGSMVAIASMSGTHPHPNAGAYAASKAALIMLCRQLAQEWGPQGVRVNAVSPGMTRTPLTRHIYAHAEVAERRAALVPLKRVAEPDDVADAVAFLLRTAHVTGENLTVDGGFSSSILAHMPGVPRPAGGFRLVLRPETATGRATE